MPLTIGERLGPYEIIAEIGAGGMGVVYRARDSRVGRDVAIKVSAGPFSDRFEREARAVAMRNPPNICTLYDGGPSYFVMELVEGEPPRGPMPLQTALDYARQIALALEAAHEKGIVHRDLKPGNIKIRSDGTVKVLDFGLAKIESPERNADDTANSPTMSGDRTEIGTILGTAAYMAPEQARGRSVDKRADGECHARHRSKEFITFLKRLDHETAPSLDLHLIVDNSSTHKSPPVPRWFRRHPRVHLHFTPTSSSWLNLVERWFAEITRTRLRRGTFESLFGVAPRLTMRLSAKVRRPRISGIFEGGATPPGGMQRRSNCSRTFTASCQAAARALRRWRSTG